MDLHPQSLDVVGTWIKPVKMMAVSIGLQVSMGVIHTVSSPREIRQVELNLIPALIQPHRHGTDERLDSGC